MRITGGIAVRLISVPLPLQPMTSLNSVPFFNSAEYQIGQEKPSHRFAVTVHAGSLAVLPYALGQML